MIIFIEKYLKKFIAILALVSWAIICFGASAYIINDTLIKSQQSEFKRQRQEILKTAVSLLNTDDLLYLKKSLKLEYDEDYSALIQSTREYKSAYKILNALKTSHSRTVDDIYVLTPSEDVNFQYDIVDTYTVNTKYIFNYKIDVSTFPVMREAMTSQTFAQEDSFVYDKDTQTYSISSYEPLFDSKNEFIGILGIDFFIENYSNQIAKIYLYSISMSISIALICFFLPLIILRLVKIEFILDRKMEK